MKKCENENDESDGNEDRLSDLPNGVLLHILSLLDTKHAVQSCVLSTRWRHLWKSIPTLMLYASSFSTPKRFAIFVSKVLTLRDSSVALQALDIDRRGNIEPQLLKKVVDYVCSNNTHIQGLRITACSNNSLILSCVSSCRALTSLKLDIYPRRNIDGNFGTLFPKYLNLPALTSLDLTNFAFCGGENGCAEPFSPFTKLNSLVIFGCKVKDAQILKISSETLVDLAMYHNSSDFSQIELDTPSLCTFTITGIPNQKICGSGLSSVKQVNIDAKMHSNFEKSPMVLLSWLLDLANVKSLTVSSITLQILSLVPDLLEVELHSLSNLKSMKIKLEPLQTQLALPYIVKDAMLKKVAAKSSEEAAKLQKAFKAGLEPPPIPVGIVDFLRQNSPLAEVNILTIYSNCFNLKEVKDSIKGAKIINYHSQFATSASSSTADASAAAAAPASVAAPASAAPLNLHLCHTEKDDKSSNEDKVGKHQHNSDSPLLDNGQ